MADAPETPQGWTGEWRCCSISCGMNEEAVLVPAPKVVEQYQYVVIQSVLREME
jgi:hypothetical protein